MAMTMRWMGAEALATALVSMTLGGGVAAQPAAPTAEHAGHDCSPAGAAVPAELAGWSNRVSVKAAKGRAGLGAAALTVGQAVDATLLPTADVRYVLPPEKPGSSDSYGGVFAFSVKSAGTYRVALGAGAWIDVVKGGKTVASTAHGHGPDCSGVRKMVDFALTPGQYVLQLAGNGAEALPVMIVRLP